MVNSFATRSGRDGRYVFNMLYFANNLGMVIGTTIVGPLYQYADGNVSPMFFDYHNSLYNVLACCYLFL